MEYNKCKNCGHKIILGINTIGWQHFPVEGDLDFCKYFGKECNCGCKNPYPELNTLTKPKTK